MADTNGANGNGRRGIRFDPTINLGHICTAGVFLVTVALAWANLDSRVQSNARDIDRVEKVAKENTGRVEVDVTRRITEQRAYVNETQVRTAEDIREMKNMMRDGFHDLEQRIERKADKPGIR